VTADQQKMRNRVCEWLAAFFAEFSQTGQATPNQVRQAGE
jgi:hypothetical protein